MGLFGKCPGQWFSTVEVEVWPRLPQTDSHGFNMALMLVLTELWPTGFSLYVDVSCTSTRILLRVARRYIFISPAQAPLPVAESRVIKFIVTSSTPSSWSSRIIPIPEKHLLHRLLPRVSRRPCPPVYQMKRQHCYQMEV